MMRKVDKKGCRNFAAPELKFNLDNGMLHLKAFDYIVRTAIRNITGQQYLLLFVYRRTRLTTGDFRPRWIMFQSKTDYLTLSFHENGTTTWQTSVFENLEREWRFEDRCAFYTHTDEERVLRFCANKKETGFRALGYLQMKLRDQKALIRRHIKQRKIIDRMAPIPTLPRDLKNWIHREIMPQYLFYDYHRRKAPMPGYANAKDGCTLRTSL